MVCSALFIGHRLLGHEQTISSILLKFSRSDSCLSPDFFFVVFICFTLSLLIRFTILPHSSIKNERKVFTIVHKLGTANNAQSGAYLPPTIIADATMTKITRIYNITNKNYANSKLCHIVSSSISFSNAKVQLISDTCKYLGHISLRFSYLPHSIPPKSAYELNRLRQNRHIFFIFRTFNSNFALPAHNCAG